MTAPARRLPLVYKRQETDREYRARLLAHPRAYCGIALDSIGEILGCLRRIVEVCEP